MAIDNRYLNYRYIPENSYNETKNGIIYTWNDFLNVAEGNEKLAMLLVDVCHWQYPETELDQMLRDGEIEEHNGGYVLAYDDDTLEQLWKEFGDVLINYELPDCPDGFIESDWFVFEAGTTREEIWRWFDEHYSKGVYGLMFCEGR